MYTCTHVLIYTCTRVDTYSVQASDRDTIVSAFQGATAAVPSDAPPPLSNSPAPPSTPASLLQNAPATPPPSQPTPVGSHLPVTPPVEPPTLPSSPVSPTTTPPPWMPPPSTPPPPLAPQSVPCFSSVGITDLDELTQPRSCVDLDTNSTFCNLAYKSTGSSPVVSYRCSYNASAAACAARTDLRICSAGSAISFPAESPAEPSPAPPPQLASSDGRRLSVSISHSPPSRRSLQQNASDPECNVVQISVAFSVTQDAGIVDSQGLSGSVASVQSVVATLSQQL